MSEDKTIEHLLEQVSTISKKYKDIAKITGENFNIFHILNMASSEVGLHSRLIGELLNPRGSHDQGAMFLQIFLEKCGLIAFVDGTDLDLTTIVIEEYIGTISEDYEIGGRIDLVLKFNNGKVIVIENKIYAVDQEKQLKRYKNAYPNAKIVYLNLGGKDEITKEISGLKVEEFIWISYKKEILNWLVESAKEAYGLPNIQYILDHYIKVINYLTNQNSNNKMKEDILKVILNSKSNIEAAFEISKIHEEIKVEIAKKLIDQLYGQIYKKLQLKYRLEIDTNIISNVGKRENSIEFHLNINGNSFRFFVYFLNDYNNLLIGLKANEQTLCRDDKFNKVLMDLISVESNKDCRGWGYAWLQKENFIYNDLNKADVVIQINEGKSIDILYKLIDKVLSDIKHLLEPK